MRQLVQRYIAEDGGATAIEYGLIVALISVAIIAVLATIGVRLIETFQETLDALTEAGR